MVSRLRQPIDSTGVPHASDRRVFTSTKATSRSRRAIEIEIMAAPPKAVRLDVPAARGEVGQRDTLTCQAAHAAVRLPIVPWGRIASPRAWLMLSREASSVAIHFTGRGALLRATGVERN